MPILLLARILSCGKNLLALNASLLVSALFLLLCDCVLRASFRARQEATGHGSDLGTPLSLGLTCFEVSSWLRMVTTLLLRALRTKSTRVYGDLFSITMAKFDELVVLIWAASGRNWLS